MSAQIALEMPEPWLALRIDPAMRDAEIGRVLGPSPDRLTEQFLRRLLDDLEEARTLAVAVLTFPEEVAPDAMAALTLSAMVMPEGLDSSSLLGLADPNWETSTWETKAGTVVRQLQVATVDQLARQDGLAPVFLNVRYLLPEPASRATVVLNCATPSIAYTEEFERIFDTLAETLRVVDDEVD